MIARSNAPPWERDEWMTFNARLQAIAGHRQLRQPTDESTRRLLDLMRQPLYRECLLMDLPGSQVWDWLRDLLLQ